MKNVGATSGKGRKKFNLSVKSLTYLAKKQNKSQPTHNRQVDSNSTLKTKWKKKKGSVDDVTNYSETHKIQHPPYSKK